MKKVALLLALPLAAALLGASRVPDDANKAIVSNYATTCAAVLDPSDAKVDKMTALFAPDFVLTDLSGAKHDKAAVVPMLKQELTTFKASSCKNDVQSLTSSAAGAIVAVSQQTVDGTVVMQGSDHPVTAVNKARDTWVERNGSWLLAASTSLHTTVTIDGRIVQDAGQ